MRLAALLDIGTAGYADREARRIRAVNAAALLGAATTALFLLVIPGPPHPLTVFVFAGYLTAPFLHRFGPIVAPLVLLPLVWLHVVRVVFTLGTGDGIILVMLSTAALSVLLLGIDRLRLAAIAAVLACALAVALHLAAPFSTGAAPDGVLRASFAVNIALNIAVLFAITAYVARLARQAEDRAEAERQRSDALAARILPAGIAARLRADPGAAVAERHPDASVLVADLAGFTALAGRIAPEALVGWLAEVYAAFDALAARHGVEKIKTSGDAYIAVCGLPEPRADHAAAMARFALALGAAADALRTPEGTPMALRIGVATGPVVAGVVGATRFFYDVWGDTVNLAARLEETGAPGRVQIDAATRAALPGGFALTPRGPIALKGKGTLDTWWLDAAPPAPA